MPDRLDPAGDLRGHIEAAHAAVDRLVREAAALAEASDRALRERLGDVPERGWDVAEAVRELLLALRALIDWYLERLERGPAPARGGQDRVEDIPIS